MWITRVSVANPVFATMLMVGIAVLGIVSYAHLRIEQMPDTNLPFVLVITSYPGCRPRSCRSRCDQAGRVRGEPGLGRAAHPLEFLRGIEPGVHRIPAVDGHVARD